MRAARGSLRAAAGAAVLLVAQAAGAVCLQPPIAVCNEFFRSASVLVGSVLAREDVPAAGDDEAGWLYRIRVQRVLRGPAAHELQVFSENSSGRLVLDEGRTHLLFAEREGGRLVVTGCGSSGPVEERAQEIREIEALGSAPTFIEGRVVARTAGSVGVARVPIAIEGSGGRSETVTDAEGAFRVEVTPGSYAVRARSEGIQRFDLSTDDPERLSLQRGQCAQVQFVR